MRKIIGILALVFIVGSLLLALAALNRAPKRFVVDGSEFMHLISLLAAEKIGEPIEGFSPEFYMNAFPGLVESDFGGVETMAGRFIYSAGELKFVRSFGKPITTADESVSASGHAVLLKNLRARLGLSDADDILRAISVSPVYSFEECAAAGYPVTESYPRGCRAPDGRLLTEEVEGVVCTQDAMLCPDGSYVGRVGPNCEFAVCPDSSSASKSGIRGRAMIGPTCPVQIQVYPPDPVCADRPYDGSLAATTPDGDIIISVFNPSPDGAFSVELPAGDYAIRSASGNNILPRCSAIAPVRVSSGSFSEVEVYCDSGLR